MPYLMVVCANICFAVAAIIYTAYSHRCSVNWMNAFKASVALVCCMVWLTAVSAWSFIPLDHALIFWTSGLLGLGVGDLFILGAFTIIGPSRTMMLWGFQPLLIAIGSYFMFGQVLSPQKVIAI